MKENTLLKSVCVCIIYIIYVCLYYHIANEETKLIIHDLHLLPEVPDPDDFYRLDLSTFQETDHL